MKRLPHDLPLDGDPQACPKCEQRQAIVLETRDDPGHRYIRRRRSCLRCGGRWSTVEIQYDDLLHLVEVVDHLRALAFTKSHSIRLRHVRRTTARTLLKHLQQRSGRAHRTA